MATNGASVRLKITVTGGQVLADLEFANSSRKDVFIEKYNACIEGEIENNVFQIRTGERVLDYTGMLAKRRRPLPEDYVRLAPGRMFAARADLTGAYECPRGAPSYEARYCAVLSYPDRECSWSLASV